MAYEIVARKEHRFWQQSLTELAKITKLSRMTLSRTRSGVPASAITVGTVLVTSKLRFEDVFRARLVGSPERKIHIPDGYRLVPIEPDDDDDPELAENKPTIAPDGVLDTAPPRRAKAKAKAKAKVRALKGEKLPVTYETACQDDRFNDIRVKIDPNVPDDEEDDSLYTDVSALAIPITVAGKRRASQLIYGVEESGAVRVWPEVKNFDDWTTVVVGTITDHFGLTEDEVLADIDRGGIFTSGRAESIINGREQ